MICHVCNKNPVTLKGASTCSLKCASELNGDDPETIKTRLGAEVYRVYTICRNEKERLQKEWQKANPGLML